MAENQFLISQKYFKEYKCSYLWHAPFATVYNVSKADDLQELLKHSDYLVQGKVYGFAVPFLGRGILLSEGRKWQAARKILAQFFHHSFVKNAVEPLESETDKFIQKLESFEGKKVNLQKELAQYILNTFCEVVLGAEFDTTSFLNIMSDIDRLLSDRFGRLLMFIDLFYYWLGSGQEFNNLSKSVRQLTSKMVDERKTKLNAVGKRLLDHLLASPLDDQSVCDQVDNLIFAGFDSTATTLSFILFQLALDDEVQQKAYSEVISQDPIDYQNMEYLGCIIKEGMRLYPGVPKLHRTLTKDIECGNLIFAKGTEVSINIFDIHRDPKYYPDPEKFYPERFLASADLGERNPYIHVPFSFGARSCLGKKFAILEMKILLSKVIRNFRVVPHSQREGIKRFKTGFLLRSLSDFDVTFLKRN